MFNKYSKNSVKFKKKKNLKTLENAPNAIKSKIILKRQNSFFISKMVGFFQILYIECTIFETIQNRNTDKIEYLVIIMKCFT